LIAHLIPSEARWDLIENQLMDISPVTCSGHVPKVFAIMAIGAVYTADAISTFFDITAKYKAFAFFALVAYRAISAILAAEYAFCQVLNLFFREVYRRPGIIVLVVDPSIIDQFNHVFPP
jgi:hypothetical protein